MPSSKKLQIFFVSQIVLIGLGLFWSISAGAMKIDLTTIWNSIFRFEEVLEMQLVRDTRIPRALSALLAGGILGMSGAMMQGVTRNPVAEPSLMGISQGATLTVAILYSLQAVANPIMVLAAAFIGAMGSGLLVIAFTSRNPANLSMGKVLLAGTALSTFFLSLSSLIALLRNQSALLGFWLAGGFRTANWSGVLLLGIVGVLGFMAALWLAPKINVVHLGDDVAIGLGENPGKVRLFTLLLMIPLCAATVAVARNIAFVGLIIPQIVKLAVGQDYRKIIPLSFITGSSLLIIADIVARMINLPYETPIGIFTSLLGVPWFIYLVRKERG